MTFLELCQAVARRSGTVSGGGPASVANQKGRLEKVVDWTSEAWRLIQTAHPEWRWLYAEFEGSLLTSANRYTPTSFSLERFAEWVRATPDNPEPVTVYSDSVGVSDEGPLYFIDWPTYRRMYERGAQTAMRPVHWSISPAREFCVGPKPDATYKVRGEYRKGVQTLVENDDIPEMPERFHDAIVYRGLMLLHELDEAEMQLVTQSRNFREVFGALRRDQLPVIGVAPALA